MTAQDLALMTLQVLDMQQEYFRTRSAEKLQESKAAERKLRQACKDIISPPRSEQPDLFGVNPVVDERLSAFGRRLTEWHVRKCGDRPVNLPRTFAKVAEEFGELAEAWNREDADSLAVEAADMVIVLFHFVRGAGRDLAAALLSKATIIEERLAKGTA